ncbi:MAG TPA: efflux RND transporter periplasmic adaptor subunit [Longimicrobiales bacterium]
MSRYDGRNRGTYTIAAAALVIAAAGCGAGKAPAEAAAIEAGAETTAVVLSPRDVAVAERSTIRGSVVLTGSLNPYRVVEVRAQVPGLIGQLRVDRGSAVRRGQVMATIEAEGIRSQAAGARAAVAAAEANRVLAQQQLESARKLHEAGAMSDIDFKSAEAAFEAAQAQLAAAQAQAASAIESAQRTTIEAPITGEVSRRMVSEGEAVSPGDALFTVVNTDTLELAGQIPVDQAARVRVGMPVEFTLDAYAGRVFRGEVARIEPTADPATRQVGVYLRLENEANGLVGGLFATGRVLTGAEQEAVVVPIPAVRSPQGDEPYVWVVADGTATRRPVRTGARDERRGVVQVTEGLAGGERVVVSPGALTDGARVRIATENVEGVSVTAEKASTSATGEQ